MPPATTVFDVYQACHPETPLEPGDPRYVDLREGRGGRDLARVIYRRIATTEHPDYHKHLITGHRGCGKSTELRQIKGALEEKGSADADPPVEGPPVEGPPVEEDE